jgi:hypothetical protein
MTIPFEAMKITEDTTQLGAWLPLPGLGVLPVNAFVIGAEQPVLVDTGAAGMRGSFLAALGRVIDPAELRWIWMTHIDADHVGNLAEVLKLAPNARVVTTYLGMGKMGLLGLPLERCYLLNPGQHLDVGDRTLAGVKPPTFDAPETTGLFDTATGNLFSSDSFGALVQAPVESVSDIARKDLRNGMQLWASVDAPWLEGTGQRAFNARVDVMSDFNPQRLLSSHLPSAAEGAELAFAFDTLRGFAGTQGFVGPDQAMVERMMTAA